MTRRAEAGVVLLEVLVALAILASAGIVTMGLVAAALRSEHDARDRERTLAAEERVVTRRMQVSPVSRPGAAAAAAAPNVFADLAHEPASAWPGCICSCVGSRRPRWSSVMVPAAVSPRLTSRRPPEPQLPAA